jgi:galactose mutarotase-like enzyme
MITIANSELEISISSVGAELISIKSLKTGIEYLWQGKSERWEGKSPVLFPIIASVENDQYRVGDQVYQLGLHGFAMYKEFKLVEKKENEVTLQLMSDQSTLEVYPYRFVLKVTYQLIDKQVKTMYTVKNPGDKSIWFCLGGHPTFACPLESHLKFTDYYIRFQKKETAKRHLMTGPLMNGKTEEFLVQQNILPLDKELFRENAIILKHLDSDYVELLSEKGNAGLKLSIKGFPHLGIFSFAESEEDKYICIEPWQGIPGVQGREKTLQDKEGIIELEAENSYSKSFTIEITDN